MACIERRGMRGIPRGGLPQSDRARRSGTCRNKANELASRAESIRKFEIVPDEFTEENGLVTPSMKARRQAVVDHYRMLIDTVIYVPKK